MSKVPFDTLKMAMALKGAGWTQVQAEGITEAFAEALTEIREAKSAETKPVEMKSVEASRKMIETKASLEVRLSKIDLDLYLLKWLAGGTFGISFVLLLIALRH